VTYSDHSATQLGVRAAKGVGFGLVRAAALVGILIVATIAASSPRAYAAVKHGSPVDYLLSAQNKNGGFGLAPGRGSNDLVTGWAALALATQPQVLTPAQSQALTNADQYLAATVRTENGAGAIERTVLADRVLDVTLSDFGGRNLVTALRELVKPDGSVQDQPDLTAYGILAMRIAGLAVPAKTISWLARQQDRDGGFGSGARGASSDVDDTGDVLQALAGTHETKVVRRAVGFIRSQQNRDGGFGDHKGAPSNAQSTAFGVCGLISAGVNPRNVHRRGSPSPVSYLDSLIQPSGAVDYARGNRQSPVWVTAQAEIALSGHTF
jgi:hypothetical protein